MTNLFACYLLVTSLDTCYIMTGIGQFLGSLFLCVFFSLFNHGQIIVLWLVFVSVFVCVFSCFFCVNCLKSRVVESLFFMVGKFRTATLGLIVWHNDCVLEFKFLDEWFAYKWIQLQDLDSCVHINLSDSCCNWPSGVWLVWTSFKSQFN